MLSAQRGLLMAIVGVVSAVAVRAVLRRTRRHRATATDLASLWVGGIETMVDVPKVGTLSLAPAASAADSRASFARFGGVPEALGGVAFALTAFDPPGVTRTLAANAAANARLAADIAAVSSLSTTWRSFGVNVAEDWREDGFCLAFTSREEGREAALALARAHGQGAIFEYLAPRSDDPTLVERLTVPALGGPETAGSEVVVRLAQPPRLPDHLDW